jgi:hypothetical protein
MRKDIYKQNWKGFRYYRINKAGQLSYCKKISLKKEAILTPESNIGWDPRERFDSSTMELKSGDEVFLYYSETILGGIYWEIKKTDPDGKLYHKVIQHKKSIDFMEDLQRKHLEELKNF